MRHRNFSRSARLALAAGFVLLMPSALFAQQGRLVLRLSGMIAFAPTDDEGFDVLLVNEFGGRVTHFPQLEVDCSQLVREEDRKNCPYWASNAEGAKRVIGLDNGFTLVLTVGQPGNSNQVGRVTRETDDLERNFEQLVVPLSRLAGDEPDAATLNPEMLDPTKAGSAVSARLRLNGGHIEASKSRTGSWTFRGADGHLVHRLRWVADSATWSIPLARGETVKLELQPYPGTEAQGRVLELDGKGGAVKLTLGNEPDLFEFCGHAPESPAMPFDHFLGFYRLTQYAEEHPDDLDSLALPYADDPKKQCEREVMGEHLGTAGLRVNCMPVRFPDPVQ